MFVYDTYAAVFEL